MDSEENFKFKVVPLSPKQEDNIISNRLLIIGGLKEFKKQNLSLTKCNKYGIIHMIRQIDGYHYYPITYKLFVLLKKEVPEELDGLQINEGYFMNSNLRTKFNKLFKQKNIKDKNGKLESIQIEHLKGGIKKLVLRIINPKTELTKIEDLEVLHRNHTLCCYKLKSESNIDERTNLDEIDLAPKNMGK